MKLPYFISILCCLSSFNLVAQTNFPIEEEGSTSVPARGFYFSGGSSFENLTTLNEGVTDAATLNVSQIGYQINDRLMAGTGLSVDYLYGNGARNENLKLISLNPFVRYYGLQSKNVAAYLEIGAGTFSIGDKDLEPFLNEEFFTPNWELATGVESAILPGIVAGARLSAKRLDKGAYDLNLRFGAAVFTGALARQLAGLPSVGRGSLVVGGDWLQINRYAATESSPRIQGHSTSVRFTPEVGYFVSDNLLISADLNAGVQRLGFDFSTNSNSARQTSTITDISAYVGVSYFPFQSLTLSPYVMGGAGYNGWFAENTFPGGPNTEEATSGLVLTAAIGTYYHLSKHLALDVKLGYNQSNTLYLNNAPDITADITLNTVRLDASFIFILPGK